VLGCTLLIYVTVPLARGIQRFVGATLGRQAFLYSVLAALAAGFLALLYVLIVRLGIRTPARYFWLIVAGGLYLHFILQLKKSPEEAVHFLEYGLLGFLLFRALNRSIRDKSVYFTAALSTLLIGTFDEILQWSMPGRYWDFADAGLNGLSGGLFQLILWGVVKPETTDQRISRRSVVVLSAAFGFCLLLFSLCASNTPARVARYSERLPFLSFLRREEPMSEFGFRHEDPDIGVFFSRLSLDELRKIDEAESGHWAPILDTSKDIPYEDFLAAYPSPEYPFLYELRVHTYRRDHYFGSATASSDPRDRREPCWIAYKEDLILRKYFPRTLANSRYLWGPEILSDACLNVDPQKPYKSAVSDKLITAFSERTMWAVTLGAMLSLVVLHSAWAILENRRRRGPRTRPRAESDKEHRTPRTLS